MIQQPTANNFRQVPVRSARLCHIASLDLGHTRSTIQSDYLAVEHLILNDLANKRRKLGRATGSCGEDKGVLEVFANLVRHSARHARLKETGGNGHGADAVAAKISSHGKREGSDGALGGGIRDLAILAVKGGGRGDHDDDAVIAVGGLALGLDHGRAGLTGEVNGAAQVYANDEIKVIDAEGLAVTVDNLSS